MYFLVHRRFANFQLGREDFELYEAKTLQNVFSKLHDEALVNKGNDAVDVRIIGPLSVEKLEQK